MNFKNLLNIALVILITILNLGCSDDPIPIFEGEINLNFKINQSDISPVLEGTLNIPDVATLFSQNAAIHGVSPDQVKSITAGRGVLEATFQNVDLTFFEEISIQVISKNDPNLQAEIFYLNNIPFNEGPSANLFGSLGDLKNILVEDVIDFRIVFKYRTTIPIDFFGDIRLTYLVFTE